MNEKTSRALGRIEGKLDGMQKQLDGLQKTIEGVDGHISDVDSRLRAVEVRSSVFAATIATVISAVGIGLGGKVGA